MDRRRDRGQATRQHILDEATRLFTRDGYEAVSIEALLSQCGISRGALYHHFAGKDALFAAVLETTEARIADHLAEAARTAGEPAAALRVACMAWLDLAEKDATVRRVVLVDAPGVIGWQAWRELDQRYSLGLLRAGLGALAEAGRIGSDQLDMLAHLLLAALVEMALLIARSAGDARVAREGREAVARLLDGLFPPRSLT